MAAVLFIFLSGSGADGGPNPPLVNSSQTRELTATPRAAPDTCPSARRAVRYYQRQYAKWMAKMGVGWVTGKSGREPAGANRACPRYLAHVLQRKARRARQAYERWSRERAEYQYDWQSWLPDKWRRIAICETGLNWRHSNSSYEGAFGFAKQSWDSFKYQADRKAGPYPADAWQATPRQQYEVALAIYRRYGLSGWGCRNA